MSLNNFDTMFVCPIEYSMSVFGGKWKPRILCILYKNKLLRYNQIRSQLNGITDIMLSKSLKELEEYQMIIRKQYNQIPPKVEYSLSDKGYSAIPVLIEIMKWGQTHKENIVD